MSRWLVFALFSTLSTLAASGQVASTNAQQEQSAERPSAKAFEATGTFTVHIGKALDSRKLKPGDLVEAKLDGDISIPSFLEIPRGSTVVGHVIEAKARSNNDSESTLEIIFDKIPYRGEDIPIHGVIRAVAPGPAPAANSALGHGGSATDQLWRPPDTQGDATPVLTTASRGVLGIRDLKLLEPDGTLSSGGKEVKLAAGTKLALNMTIHISK